jgi:hypothetical protein
MPVNALVPIGLEGSSARPTYPLYPPLGKSEDIKLFAEDGRAVAFALSPRGNEFTVFETVVRLLQNRDSFYRLSPAEISISW